MTTHPETSHHDARFDAAMRALHREALGQVTPGVRWRLGPAQPGSAQRPPRTQRVAPRMAAPLWAAGMAAMFALAIGFGLWRNAEAPASLAPGARLAGADSPADDGATVLGEDPDFYAWLASDDAGLVAME